MRMVAMFIRQARRMPPDSLRDGLVGADIQVLYLPFRVSKVN